MRASCLVVGVCRGSQSHRAETRRDRVLNFPRAAGQVEIELITAGVEKLMKKAKKLCNKIKLWIENEYEL